VLSRRFSDDRVVVHCRVPAALLGRIPEAEATVRPHAHPDVAPVSSEPYASDAEPHPAPQ